MIRQPLGALHLAQVNTACIGQHVGHDGDAIFGQDLIRLQGGGGIGGLHQDARPDVPGIVFGDDTLQGRRHQYVAVATEHFVVAEGLTAGEILQAAVLLVVIDQGVDIQAVPGKDTAVLLGHPHHLATGRLEGPGRHRADLAETLDSDPGTFHVEIDILRGCLKHLEHSPAGGFITPERAAYDGRLVVNGGRCVAAGDLLVLVQHPGHALHARTHVGAGHIAVRTGGPQVADVGPA